MESSQDGSCGFDSRGAKGGAEIGKDILDGGNGITTEENHFFVEVVQAVLVEEGG